MGATDSRALPTGSLRGIRASPHGFRRVPGPALQGLLALLIYAAVFAWLAMPLVRDVRLPVIARALPDANFYVWAFRWVPYAMSHGLNLLYTNQIVAPGGIDLAWATPSPRWPSPCGR